MKRATVIAVMEKLEVDPLVPDADGLRTVYAAWCSAVPFDNILKLIHIAERSSGPLPGSTASDFFDAWLAGGTGGTCWAGNGALHDLLAALGFDVVPALATMLSAPGTVGPNHGTVIAFVDGERWIVDASILSGEPIRIPRTGEPAFDGPLPRFAWVDEQPAVLWRSLSAPNGFHCRIDRVGVDAPEWDRLHQSTAAWSPFNFGLTARVLRGTVNVGVSAGTRFAIGTNGALSTTELDDDGRIRFLVEELGVAEELARRIPCDRPVEPRPLGDG